MNRTIFDGTKSEDFPDGLQGNPRSKHASC